MDQCKACSRCRELKPCDQFGRSKQTPDGLFRYCRECKRVSDRASYARHKEKRSAQKKGHYEANADVIKARVLVAYHANPDPVKRRAALWAKANPERRRAIRLASERRRYALDPERKREVCRRRHAAIRRGCAIYQFTPEQVAAKVAYWGGKCWVCRAPYEAIDHVKPLKKGGAHMLANLRPICTSCNTRKRDSWPYTPVREPAA